MSSLKRDIDSIDLQDRDIALLRGLFESRTFTAIHATVLYFDGKKEAAKKRLYKLKRAGLIGGRRQRVVDPAALFLTRKGLAILNERGVLFEYPPLSPASLDKRSRVSDLTLRHELEIMDVKAAFHLATKMTEQFEIAEFSTWPLLYQFRAFRHGQGPADVMVKPDGLIRIHEKENDGGLSEHTFFLEVDRSNETQDYLITRAGSYLDYYKSGGFAERNGGNRSEFKEYPFRVLMVFKTAARRNNTAERLLQSTPPILTQVCLSTFAEVKSKPLDPIWIRPIDYREITKGTPFDPERQSQSFGYSRKTARELFIERKIKKFPLLS